MSRKLHKFQTVAEYQAYSASTDYTTPCVAVVEENNVIYYDYGDNKPQVDLSSYKVESQETYVGGDKYGKSAITKINYIPSGITRMDGSFSDLSSIISVPPIPSSVYFMGNTFSHCSSLRVAPKIPSNVEYMPYAFNNCSSIITAPELPSGLLSIIGAFSYCINLVNAPSVIPSGITSLKDTFRSCESLVTAPLIPSGITDMTYTFAFCSSLKELTLFPTTPPIYSSTLNGCTELQTIYVPDSAVDAYKTATGWLQFSSKFKPLSEKPSE